MGTPHGHVWPNLELIGTQIRVIHPIAVDETEVFLYPALLKDVPDEVNAQRLREHEWFYGPAGFGQPDDVEIFERNMQGLQANLEPWLVLRRGQHREQRLADGSGRVALWSDEVTQRGQMRQWKKVMTRA
jgi:hypothetical protein